MSPVIGCTAEGRKGRRSENGSMSIELVLLTPILVAAILVIAAGARYVDARGQSNAAAYAAARAASLTQDSSAASAAGEAAARRSFAEHGRSCAHLTVRIDTHAFRPGGHIQALVTCTADLSDITGFGLPGHRDFTASAVVPIEQHRTLR
ncbi:TadE/TadG family type IV pilus assembly protein [Nocardioides terrisoli]|uniref:TadE/TadG family type IV pilus assembly protein n=1 Tax=Nocardioides terrisoli TaxID=3388267 RepID=UPI00287B85E2|nr:TadE/TadG family type IV pilus assembly protein [Nocardioides marmorisolisilvae]